MKYKSALVTDLSGSIEGITASHNKGGRYFRARVVPTNPSTPRQADVRQAFAEASMLYAGHNQLAQDLWNTFAPTVAWVDSMGQPIQLSGQQASQMVNVPILHVNQVLAPDPAFVPLAVPPVNPTQSPLSASPAPLAPSAASQQFNVSFDNSDPWANDDDGYMVIYASIPQSNATNFNRGRWRLAAVVRGDNSTPPTSPVTAIDYPYPIQEGQKIWFDIRVGDPNHIPSFRDQKGPVTVTA